MSYRAHITGATHAVRDVLIHVTVQSSEDGTNWADVQERTMRIQHKRLDEVLDNDSLTDQEKRQRLAAIFKLEAASWGYQAAHATVTKLNDLVSWPVDIAL